MVIDSGYVTTYASSGRPGSGEAIENVPGEELVAQHITEAYCTKITRLTVSLNRPDMQPGEPWQAVRNRVGFITAESCRNNSDVDIVVHDAWRKFFRQ